MLSLLTKIIRTTSTFNKTKQNDIAAKLISQKVQWQVEKNQDWQPFNLYLNTQLEIKHMSKDSSNNNSQIRLLDERNNYFTADVDKCTLVYDNEPKNVYRIRRSELVINTRFPTNWSTTQSLELVKLAPNSTEYNQVLNLFQSRGLNGIIKNVLYIMYDSYLETILNELLILRSYRLRGLRIDSCTPNTSRRKSIFKTSALRSQSNRRFFTVPIRTVLRAFGVLDSIVHMRAKMPPLLVVVSISRERLLIVISTLTLEREKLLVTCLFVKF